MGVRGVASSLHIMASGQTPDGIARAIPVTSGRMSQETVPHNLPLLCHWQDTDTKLLPRASGSPLPGRFALSTPIDLPSR